MLPHLMCDVMLSHPELSHLQKSAIFAEIKLQVTTYLKDMWRLSNGPLLMLCMQATNPVLLA